MDATCPVPGVEDFATSVAKLVAEQWPTRGELKIHEAQRLARQGLPDPTFVEAEEPGHVGKRLAKLDPTEKEIYGYWNKKGQFVPGLTHEVRTQGFISMARNSEAELATMTADERAELADRQGQASPVIGPMTAEAYRTSVVREFVPEFFPAWRPETFIERRQHNPSDMRTRQTAVEDGVPVKECSAAEIMWGLN